MHARMHARAHAHVRRYASKHASFLFQLIDVDNGGSLDILEFFELATIMNVNFLYVDEMEQVRADASYRMHPRAHACVCFEQHASAWWIVSNHLRSWIRDRQVADSPKAPHDDDYHVPCHAV